MTKAEYQAAVAAYLAKKGVTRCPTVCVVPTRANIAEDDRAAYRNYVKAKEAARLERLKSSPFPPAAPPSPGSQAADPGELRSDRENG
jgi:hypothetical protein